jgi:hypothetical protein
MPSTKQLTAAFVAAVVLSSAAMRAQDKTPETPMTHYKLN